MIHAKRMTTVVLVLAVVASLLGVTAAAQAPIGNDGYTFKIYSANSAAYPFVQLYLRTWDQEREPLVNVNYANIGLMVKGRNYDPGKFHTDPNSGSRRPQYSIETLQNREEAFRTVIVLDCSLSMAGKPFADAQNALQKYVQAKRPTDQIAVLAIRDTDQGYQLVSGFEKSPTLLYQRIADVKCDGKKTRLYDSVAAALEMCATASQGGSSNAGAEHVVLNTIMVLSDGKDEGSAIARDELMNRIGELTTPVPIYSLAYSSGDEGSFRNLEALSKGSFGRYWTHEDSQEFARTVQDIHRINRSDYVVTFRSYVPVDGDSHPVKVGISYPANTGRFVFDSTEFEAIESPLKFFEEGRRLLKKLEAAYPELPTGCPYMKCDETGPVIGPPEGEQEPRQITTKEGEKSGTGGGGGLGTENGGGDGPLDFVKQNAAMLGLGGGIGLVLIAVLAWVKGGGANSGGSGGRGSATTAPNRGTGNGSQGNASGFPSVAEEVKTDYRPRPSEQEDHSDKMTRF